MIQMIKQNVSEVESGKLDSTAYRVCDKYLKDKTSGKVQIHSQSTVDILIIIVANLIQRFSFLYCAVVRPCLVDNLL